MAVAVTVTAVSPGRLLQEGVPHMWMQPLADTMGCELATFPSPTRPILDDVHPYPFGFP